MSGLFDRRTIAAPAIAVAGIMSMAVTAFACTNYVGVVHMWGDQTTTTSGSEVLVTGNDSWNGAGAMTQSVSAKQVQAKKYTSGTVCGANRGCFYLQTGTSGSNSLNPTASAITYDVNTIPDGYTSHTTWGGDPNYDCMDWQGTNHNVRNVGSVSINTSGAITSAWDGSQGAGNSVTVTSGVAGPFYVATNETSANTNSHESGVCISDTTSTNGNQMPLDLI